MASYAPRTDLLRPDVQLDTQGIAPGISAAGQAFADTFRTYGQNLRQDAQHQQLREEQLADYGMQRQDRITDRDAEWAHELANYGMKRGDMLTDRATLREQDLADYGMKRDDAKSDKELEREFKKQEETDAADGILEAAMRSYPGTATPEVIAAASKLSPKAKLEFAQGMHSFGAQQYRQEQSRDLTELPQTDTYQMTGNGQLVPPRKAANTLTADMLMKFGLVPQQVTQGGVTYKAPPPLKPTRPIKIKEGETLVDPATGRPVSSAPKTAQSYYGN